MTSFLQEYCASESVTDWNLLAESSRHFLERLGLPAVHPFCEEAAAAISQDGSNSDIPPMGPLTDFSHDNMYEALVTFAYHTLPPYIAFAGLWSKLLAGIVAPLGLLYMVAYEQDECNTKTTRFYREPSFTIRILTTLSSLLVMTDSLYVYEYGARYGVLLFMASLALSAKACVKRHLPRLPTILLIVLSLVALLLTWDVDTRQFHFGEVNDVDIRIEPSLYYNTNNPLIKATVAHWPEHWRTYGSQATKWMYTGDARTGLPFFLNAVPDSPLVRVFLPVSDGEVLALDVAFPSQGYNASRNVYLILHGVNGGSSEEYARDLQRRRTNAGDTVIVMVSRGLMDTPLKTYNTFHGARWSDAHETATAIRRAMEPGQLLAGVGYSMGAIILNTYAAASGSDCALDVAFSISGALECRYEANFLRPQRWWQPMIAEYIRRRSLDNWGNRMKARLTRQELVEMHRATNVVAMDQYTAVSYNRNEFANLTQYYSEMSALGDFELSELESWTPERNIDDEQGDQQHLSCSGKRISNITIPLCILHALDDPISTWRTNAANFGLMHPKHLVQCQGNLVLLLTAKGGHVGWPIGWLPFLRNWEWMNEAAASFVDAVGRAKRTIE